MADYKFHYSGSKAATNLDEPMYFTKWEAIFVLPQALQAIYNSTEIITQQITKIGGLQLNRVPAPTEQLYRGYKRRFIGSVPETTHDLDMTFTVNVDKDGIIYPWNIMRDWIKLGWDDATGLQTLKRDYVGSITINIGNKVGTVLRRVYFPILFPIEPPNAWDIENNTEGQYEMTVKFAGENPSDFILGKKV
jgi:hypothetical protein